MIIICEYFVHVCVYVCVRESGRGGIGLLSIIYTVGWMNFFSK